MSRQHQCILAGVFVLVAVVIGARGCGHYGEVNVATFRHAKALYSVCNRRDVARLETCAKMIAEAETSAEISSNEASYLREIVATAQVEEWQEAQVMARQLMADQAGR